MWDKFGIGIFFVVVTAIITFGIMGLSTFMERLYKKGNKRK
ncbi:MAG: hypothetical protein AABY66_03535 [Nitrospirota bacterium]